MIHKQRHLYYHPPEATGLPNIPQITFHNQKIYQKTIYTPPFLKQSLLKEFIKQKKFIFTFALVSNLIPHLKEQQRLWVFENKTLREIF